MAQKREFPNALYEYLLHQVPPEQLHVFLTMHYAEIVPNLPGARAVPVSQYIFDSVRGLQQYGCINDALFIKLAELRPRDPDVRTVAVAVLGHDPFSSGRTQPGARPGTNPGGAVRPVLLVLLACPDDQIQLDLAREGALITDMLAPVRDRFQIVFGWSVSADEALDLLTDHSPVFLHFSGHGGRDGTLLLVGAEGTTRRVRYDALARFFAAMRTPPRVVVLNNCFSGAATAPLTNHVDVVIGMRKEISDEAAMTFSRRFYRELGQCRDLEEAFALARAGLGTLDPPAHELPQLSPRSGFDPRTLRIC